MAQDAPPVVRPRSAAMAGSVTATAALPMPARPNSRPTSEATRPASVPWLTIPDRPVAAGGCSGSAPGTLLARTLGDARLGSGRRLGPSRRDRLRRLGLD